MTFTQRMNALEIHTILPSPSPLLFWPTIVTHWCSDCSWISTHIQVQKVFSGSHDRATYRILIPGLDSGTLGTSDWVIYHIHTGNERSGVLSAKGWEQRKVLSSDRVRTFQQMSCAGWTQLHPTRWKSIPGYVLCKRLQWVQLTRPWRHNSGRIKDINNALTASKQYPTLLSLRLSSHERRRLLLSQRKVNAQAQQSELIIQSHQREWEQH